jgi:hypothetical protein
MPRNDSQSDAASASVKWGLSERLVLTCLEHAPNGSIRGLAIREALNRDGTITRDQIYSSATPGPGAQGVLRGWREVLVGQQLPLK